MKITKYLTALAFLPSFLISQAAPAEVTLLSVQNKAASSQISELQQFYDEWKASYLVETVHQGKPVAFVNYRQPKQGESPTATDEEDGTYWYSTVSEAHGYGMLALVYMADYDSDARMLFDKMNNMRTAFPSKDGSKFMQWKQYKRNEATKVQSAKNPLLNFDMWGLSSATDGDLDMAYALYLAHKKWGASLYFWQARSIVKALEREIVRSDYSLKLGDWNNDDSVDRPHINGATRLSDYTFKHFRAFAEIGNNEIWKNVTETGYQIINDVVTPKGVFPDFASYDSKEARWINAKDPAPLDKKVSFLEGNYDGDMYYNAARVPWRLASAVIEYNDNRAQQLLNIFSGRSTGVGHVSNLGPKGFPSGVYYGGTSYFDGTRPNEGTAINTSYQDGTFTAPHMASLYVTDPRINGTKENYQYWLNRHLSGEISGLLEPNQYYASSITLLVLAQTLGCAAAAHLPEDASLLCQ